FGRGVGISLIAHWSTITGSLNPHGYKNIIGARMALPQDTTDLIQIVIPLITITTSLTAAFCHCLASLLIEDQLTFLLTTLLALLLTPNAKFFFVAIFNFFIIDKARFNTRLRRS